MTPEARAGTVASAAHGMATCLSGAVTVSGGVMPKKMKGRNPVAYALALRGAGKPMKDRRAPRGPERSAKRDVGQALEDEGLDYEGLYDE